MRPAVTSDVVLEAAAVPRGMFLPVLTSALPRQPAASVLSRYPAKCLGLGSESLFLARPRLGLEVSASIMPEELWLHFRDLYSAFTALSTYISHTFCFNYCKL